MKEIRLRYINNHKYLVPDRVRDRQELRYIGWKDGTMFRESDIDQLLSFISKQGYCLGYPAYTEECKEVKS